MANLVQTYAPYLPYLRRFSRALTGSQTDGDRYVRVALEALVAGDVTIDGGFDAKVALYRMFLGIWNSSGAKLETQDDAIALTNYNDSIGGVSDITDTETATQAAALATDVAGYKAGSKIYHINTTGTDARAGVYRVHTDITTGILSANLDKATHYIGDASASGDGDNILDTGADGRPTFTIAKIDTELGGATWRSGGGGTYVTELPGTNVADRRFHVTEGTLIGMTFDDDGTDFNYRGQWDKPSVNTVKHLERNAIATYLAAGDPYEYFLRAEDSATVPGTTFPGGWYAIERNSAGTGGNHVGPLPFSSATSVATAPVIKAVANKTGVVDSPITPIVATNTTAIEY